MSIYQIRSGVFETNSSSSHSIFIPSVDREYNYEEGFMEGDEIDMTVNETFGWEAFKQGDWMDVVRYLTAYYREQESKLEWIADVISDFSGANPVSLRAGEHGSVDHNSLYIVPDDMTDSQLKSLIFGDGIIFGGNDNSGTPEGFHNDVGRLINKDQWDVTTFLDDDGNIIDMAKIPQLDNIEDESTPYFSGPTSDALPSIEEVMREVTKEFVDEEVEGVTGWSFDDDILNITYSTPDSYWEKLEVQTNTIPKEKVEA